VACAAACAEQGKAASAEPELARVAAAWPDLPAAIRAAVLALVDAARKAP
jgi:hypothetical protein